MNADKKRRVLLFTGDGKGKTTAALGMVLRARGHGIRALVVQFVKADPRTGEISALGEIPGARIVQAGLGFIPPGTGEAQMREHRAAAERGLQEAAEAMASGDWGLVVLDEICYAVARGLLQERRVTEAVELAAEKCSVVLTGRGATEGLVALADTVTEMRCVKHAIDSGRKAQEGIEL